MYAKEHKAEKQAAATARWREKYPEKDRAYQELYNERRRNRYASDPEYREKILTNKVWKETMRVQQQERRNENKQAVFDHYGRVCLCCGETRECFLTIDHLKNDGAEHRKSLSPSGNRRNVGSAVFYAWLVKNNFPEGFAASCYNCNSGRARCGGICPHESERAAASAKLTAGAQTDSQAS